MSENLYRKSSELYALRSLMKTMDVHIQRYRFCEKNTPDFRLKALLAMLLKQDEEHYRTLIQLEQGIIPIVGRDDRESRLKVPDGKGRGNRIDARYCREMYEGEKFLSSEIDQTIFKVRDSSVRNVLNYIQKQQQEHGRLLGQYMDEELMYY